MRVLQHCQQVYLVFLRVGHIHLLRRCRQVRSHTRSGIADLSRVRPAYCLLLKFSLPVPSDMGVTARSSFSTAARLFLLGRLHLRR